MEVLEVAQRESHSQEMSLIEVKHFSILLCRVFRHVCFFVIIFFCHFEFSSSSEPSHACAQAGSALAVCNAGWAQGQPLVCLLHSFGCTQR